MALPPSGWYLDPDASATLRWWSGDEWTDLRKPRGLVAVLQSGAASRNVFAWVALLVAVVGLVTNPLGLISLLALVFASVGLARARKLTAQGVALTGRSTALAGLIVALFALLLAGLALATGRPVWF